MSVEIWTRPNCTWCVKVKNLLTLRGIAFQERYVTPNTWEEFQRVSGGAKTVPQVIVNGERIGGYEATAEAVAHGKI